jgi:hypothetical protein
MKTFQGRTLTFAALAETAYTRGHVAHLLTSEDDPSTVAVGYAAELSLTVRKHPKDPERFADFAVTFTGGHVRDDRTNDRRDGFELRLWQREELEAFFACVRDVEAQYRARGFP